MTGRPFLLLLPLGLAAHPCESCHPKEVASFSHSSMARSLRRPAQEPEGTFTQDLSGTRFTIRSGNKGTWQRMERDGGAAEYQVAFVIGSGSHASGYLVQVGDHLFQAPICYYPSRRTYDMAPGYERASEPERCHGAPEEHLRRPVPGSIVNPAKLAPAARDSICEQCHLTGITQRILNPGREFDDFHPGQRLEDVFTVYTRTGARAFKVVSHSEQLALSACARASQGKLWCGTCHDPHPKKVATEGTYNTRCEMCHQRKLEKSHPADANCISCHMPRRHAQDGGHTVFTDHRITRQREPDEPTSPSADLKAWREPEPALQARNLALAYVNAGIFGHSPAEIVRGYQMLTEVQRSAPDDVAVLNGIGRALLTGREPLEALKAFELVLRLKPNRATSEEDVGLAYLGSGQTEKAASHLERALELDPLLLSAGTALGEVYRREGDSDKADALAERMRRAMLNLPKKSGQ